MKEFVSILERTSSLIRDLTKEETYSTDFVMNTKSLHRSAVLNQYFQTILDKSQNYPKLVDKFYRYLIEDDDWVSKDNRDSRNIPKNVKSELGDACICCGRDGEIEYHHIVPHSRGGRTDSWNLVPMCKSCHRLAEFQFFIKNRDIFADFKEKQKEQQY